MPEQIKKCVVFLGTESNSGQQLEFRATGFLVRIEDPQPDGPRYFNYLVTAKHVAKQLEGKNFAVRVNTRDGKSMLVHSDGGGANTKWFFHPTDAFADVAVFPWVSSDAFNADYVELLTAMFWDDFDDNFLWDALNQNAPEVIWPIIPTVKGIVRGNASPLPTTVPEVLTARSGIPAIHEVMGIGDEVCIVGLFSYHKGTSKNHPILRTGNIAMMPDEPIQTSEGPMEAYLIEARSIGGLSGSPVFVRIECQRADKTMQHTWAFLGLIHGHWVTPTENINDMTEQDAKGKMSLNTGIAIVTPGLKLLDILYGEELKSMRRARIEAEQESNLPIPD
ncbi:MAG: hypothetical protein WCV00_07800 [Verrucomicrobiia bacterium]